MKKTAYLLCSTILGFLLQLLIHASTEMWYIAFLLSDFARYSYGFSWDELWQIHHIFTIVLAVAGISFGYLLGVKWWHIVYIEKRHWLFRKRSQ